MQLFELLKEILHLMGCHKCVSNCCVRHCPEMHAVLIHTRVDNELRGQVSLGLRRRMCSDVLGFSHVPVHGKCVGFSSSVKFICYYKRAIMPFCAAAEAAYVLGFDGREVGITCRPIGECTCRYFPYFLRLYP